MLQVCNLELKHATAELQKNQAAVVDESNKKVAVKRKSANLAHLSPIKRSSLINDRMETANLMQNLLTVSSTSRQSLEEEKVEEKSAVASAVEQAPLVVLPSVNTKPIQPELSSSTSSSSSRINGSSAAPTTPKTGSEALNKATSNNVDKSCTVVNQRTNICSKPGSNTASTATTPIIVTAVDQANIPSPPAATVSKSRSNHPVQQQHLLQAQRPNGPDTAHPAAFSSKCSQIKKITLSRSTFHEPLCFSFFKNTFSTISTIRENWTREMVQFRNELVG